MCIDTCYVHVWQGQPKLRWGRPMSNRSDIKVIPGKKNSGHHRRSSVMELTCICIWIHSQSTMLLSCQSSNMYICISMSSMWVCVSPVNETQQQISRRQIIRTDVGMTMHVQIYVYITWCVMHLAFITHMCGILKTVHIVSKVFLLQGYSELLLHRYCIHSNTSW